MTIILNGKDINLPTEVKNINDLLSFYSLEDRIVIVELNKEVLYKEQYSSTNLTAGDIIELIHFVGGG